MTYAWDFINLTCYKEHEGQNDVVYTVQWHYTGSEGGVSYTATDSTDVQYEAGEPFIAFADLTEADVQGWVEAIVDVDELRKMVRNGVREAQTPTVETLLPPWSESGV